MRIMWMLPAIFTAVLIGCSEQEQLSNEQMAALAAVANPELGKKLFTANCKGCHGNQAQGTRRGPPLVHKIYRPAHHADFGFYRAVSFGVKSHHWQFGNMPPVLGVSPQQVSHIIAYVRQEQRRAGIH